MTPGGLIPSLTTEVNAELDDEGNPRITVDGGPVMASDPGDFILSIEVPDELALEHEYHYDPLMGWPHREIWLAVEEANRYRHTLKVYDTPRRRRGASGSGGKVGKAR
jgi:hypothetical protein